MHFNDCWNFSQQICNKYGVEVNNLVNLLLDKSITINFHPDRISNNGKTILENLLEQGNYYGQFKTGTTNGGKTAFNGGDRFLWEQRIFFDAYPNNSLDRPVYGALNILKYIDGASVRFGSCHFTLKKEIVERCTFCYGDSSTNPKVSCTYDTFICVLADLLDDVKNNGKILNQVVLSEQQALAILLNNSKKLKALGRNLDFCIETHIHGDVNLMSDIDSFFIDESYRETIIGKNAEELCQKYEIKLEWIPVRQISVEEIEELFRGPMIPLIAKKIDTMFGNNNGILNAAILGEASRNSHNYPEKWMDIGNEEEVFQYIKQLWHTIGFFG
ncbi:MAG: DUF3626 domain-containing protein [Candidatus Muiribacteriota bacterium]